MKPEVFSDIHVEVGPDRPLQIPGPESNLMVFALDIGEGLSGITLTAQQSQRRGKSTPWLYGHTHASFGKCLDGTRMISSQLSYPGKRNHRFDPNKVIKT